MNCGQKDENNDVCGETYTCGSCVTAAKSVDDATLLRGQVADLQDVVKVLVAHVRRELENNLYEQDEDRYAGPRIRPTVRRTLNALDEATAGTPMMYP